MEEVIPSIQNVKIRCENEIAVLFPRSNEIYSNKIVGTFLPVIPDLFYPRNYLYVSASMAAEGFVQLGVTNIFSFQSIQHKTSL